MLSSLRERLTLALVFLLPFHAFAITVFTKLITGPNHAPLGILAIWKEILLLIILAIAVVEILGSLRINNRGRDAIYGVSTGDILILAVVILSLIVPHDWKSYPLGFKYDFLWLIAFLILRRVSWSEQFQTHLLKGLLLISGIIALLGIIGFFLPAPVFTWLGYSDLHSLYVVNGPLAPFQQIGASNIRRIQSTFSGPNQLGMWLMIPLSIVSASLISEKRLAVNSQRFALVIALLIAVLLTFSRAAWLGAFVILAISIGTRFPKSQRWKFGAGIGSALIVIGLIVSVAAPNILLRAASSKGHWEKPIAAVKLMIAHPFGMGLGTAGPASNRNSDTCIEQSPSDDISWAAAHPNLCVFVANKQVQPLDRSCNCPLLTENWYLQLGVELGWLGFAMFTALILLLLIELKTQATSYKLQATFLSLLAISIAALFLHAWEDPAVAYTMAIFLAITLPAASIANLQHGDRVSSFNGLENV